MWRFTPPEPGQPVRSPDAPPRLIESVEPEYTPEAKRARITGYVLLELVVEADGRVSGGKVLKPLPFDLTQKAIEAVEHWRFEPATLRGRPVASYYPAKVHFPPREEDESASP
jgi:periplasmic protein TonB